MRVKRGFAKTSDGLKVAYQVAGKGRPIVCLSGLGVSNFFWRHLAAAFADRYAIVTLEYRGHGRSDQSPRPYQISYDDFVEDVCAVVAELDLKDAVVIGHSAGFQIALGMYERMPKRFAALASFLGTCGNALKFFFDSPSSRLIFDVLYVLSIFYPKQLHIFIDLLVRSPLPYHLAGALNILTPGLAGKDDIQHYLEYVRNMDPRFFAALTQGAEAHSARHVLQDVRVPTLLIAAERDRFVPLHITEAMHRAIRGSELFVIKRGTHAALMEMPDVFNLRLYQFLQNRHLT